MSVWSNKVRQILVDAAPAMGAVAGSLYTYKRRGSVPWALLGALGGYASVVAVQKLAGWLMSGSAMLPTATAELPKLPVAPPAPESVASESLSGLTVLSDGSTQQAKVSLIDTDADGEQHGGDKTNIVSFGGKR